MFYTTAIIRSSQIESIILYPPGNKVNLPYSRTYTLWWWLSITATGNVTVNITILDRQKKRLLSLTPRSKRKLPLLVIPQPPRVRQIHLQWFYLPNHLLSNYLCPLLPRNNQILHRWISLPSWLAIVSWLVMSVRNVSKIICTSIVVQKTTS